MKKKSRRSMKAKEPVQEVSKKSRSSFPWVLLGGAVLTIGLFVYEWLVVRPEYIRFAQKPVFFAERHFFLERLQIPGGLLDYLAAYLTDLFQFGWLGAVILTGLVILTFFLFKAIFRPGRWWGAPILPVLLLVMMQFRYDFAVSKMLSLILSKMLSLILALEGFLIYRDALSRKPGMRFGTALALLILIYILSPGGMIFWILLCILYEVLNGAGPVPVRLLLSLGYGAAGFFLPRLAAAKVFLVPLKDAYFHHAIIYHADKIYIPGIVFAGLTLIFSGIFFVHQGKKGKPNLRDPIALIQAGAVILFLILGIGVTLFRFKDERKVLAIRYAAHQGEWDRVTRQIDAQTVQNPLCLFHFNRAFFHTGKMASEFFNIPQNFGSYGLFLNKNLAMYNPFDLSDFYFEMGYINEAERWASEALTLYGETSEVLKRLALINILQDEPAAAIRFLSRLRQNPNSRRWADHYLASLAEPAKMRSETLLQKLHTLMPRRDFVVMTNHPEIDLANILGQVPHNRMAFEYVMMDLLTRRDLDGFIEKLIRYMNLTKTPLPRCYEEALVAYLSLKKTAADTAAAQIKIRTTTFDRFKDFERVLSKYGGNSDAAYDDLSRGYANTYWYYMLYAKPVE